LPDLLAVLWVMGGVGLGSGGEVRRFKRAGGLGTYQLKLEGLSHDGDGADLFGPDELEDLQAGRRHIASAGASAQVDVGVIRAAHPLEQLRAGVCHQAEVAARRQGEEWS
jgi:hypothetical protein